MDDPETVLRPLANHLRPTIIASWMEKKKALFTENAERTKFLLDNLQKKLDEVGLLMLDSLTTSFLSLGIPCNFFFYLAS